MAAVDTFDGLLEKLAARHRTEIQAAVSKLSIENQDLRRELKELRSQLAEHSGFVEPPGQFTEHSKRTIQTTPFTSYEKAGAGRRTSANSIGGRTSVNSVSTIALRGNGPDVIEQKMDEINQHESTKLLRRLQRTLCHNCVLGDVRSEPLKPEKVLEALKKKGAHTYDLEYVTEMLQHFETVVVEIFGQNRACTPKAASVEDTGQDVCISLQDLVNLFMFPDLEDFAGEQTASQVTKLKHILVKEDLDELIHRLSALPDAEIRSTRMGSRYRIISYNESAEVREMPDTLAKVLNTVVAFCVLASILLVGVSLDNDPDHPAWTLVEGFFAMVFLGEVLIKLYYYGWRQYCVGLDWGFNWLDLIITIVAVADLVLSVFFSSNEVSAFNGTMVLKSLRLFRFARLMKLFHNSPTLKQLISMLSGFAIGAPSLIWILVIIIAFIYIMAIGFRSFFVVKNSYQDLTPDELKARCGAGDFVDLDSQGFPIDPACKLHLLYGEEFFGTVPRSMITVFRFMIGDTSTTGGKSLTQALDTTQYGEDIAVPFYFFYIPFMIIVIFGIFNIITAIFVETTINGLKHNDDKHRRRRHYETHYVQGKIAELVKHIRSLGVDKNPDKNISPRLTRASSSSLEIDEAAFHELMNNPTVRVLLGDLDVIMDESTCQFHMFDPEGIGQITLPQLLGTLLRLRGGLHKIDLVSSWSSLRTLQGNFQEFQQVALTTLQQLAVEQHSIDQRIQDLYLHVGGVARETPAFVDDLKELERLRIDLATPKVTPFIDMQPSRENF